MPYATLDDLKTYVNAQSTADDALLSRLLTASSDFVDSYCGRTFGTGTYTDTFSGECTSVHPLEYLPALSVSAVSNNFAPITQSASGSDGWLLLDGTVHLVRSNFYRGVGNCSVAYVAGTPVPGDITQAVIELAASKYTDRQHVGQSNQAGAGGSIGWLPNMIPNTVKSVLDSYRRLWVP
jgi:hypothetical protein